MKISISVSKLVRKVSPNWYRITVKADEWNIDIEVVDIFRNTSKDWWTVLDADVEVTGSRADKNTTRRGQEFKKLSTAKLYASDYAEYLVSSIKKPSILDPKYDE